MSVADRTLDQQSVQQFYFLGKQLIFTHAKSHPTVVTQ
jgi:hypothetical protein